MRDQIAVDLPHPECEASIFSGLQPLVLSTRFLLQVGKGGKEEGREAERGGGGGGGGAGRGGRVAGREAWVKKHQKTAKSEGVEEAKPTSQVKSKEAGRGGKLVVSTHATVPS